jgi:signal transduction histidine kinase/CheY-like chemotaxis protein
MQEVRRVRRAALDVSENWTRLTSELESGLTIGRNAPEWIEWKLCRIELGKDQEPWIEEGWTNCTGREARCVAFALRLATRAETSPYRLGVAISHLGRTIDWRLPISSHAARAIIRASESDEFVTALLRAARAAAHSQKTLATLSLANHACSLAWRASADTAAAQSFVANAPADERRRPPGVRLWEWRLAIARATAESATGPLSVAGIEGILVALEGMIDRLPLSTRASYNAILPIGVIASLAGLDGPAERYVETVTERPVRFDRLRVGLYRNWLVHGGTGGRAAGLERVLGSALRLRSAIDVETLLGEIALGVIAICRAERAVVVYDAGRNEVRAKVATERGVASMAPSDTEVSQTAVARVKETGHACLIDDACGDDDLGDRPSVMRFRPRSLIIAPLQTLGEYLGYVYVENRSAAKSFTDSDVQLVEGFAAQAALALENAQLVTELRRSCEELERARKDAIRGESLRVLGRMASEVAHDFNNLLTAIIGETQLLIHDAATPAQAQQLAVIERAALDGAEVIRRIQDSTRVKDDKTFEVVPMAEVLDNVLDMIRWRASGGQVRVSASVPPDLCVRGVASELREVFTNVVLNALDAMPGGGDLRVAARTESGFVEIEIEDTGVGMSADTLAKIFDPFFTTKGERGNGLGLSIAYGIMQRHGGEIRAASEVGRGTRMTVTLPVPSAADRASAAGGRSDDKAASDGTRENLRVLVVDDEPTVARILASMLQRIGAAPEVSIGGTQALRRIASGQERFDVVITDVNMPDISGIEVARELLTDEAGPRVIVMSGSLGGREEDTARMLGVRVLRKPFTISDVNRVLFSAS